MLGGRAGTFFPHCNLADLRNKVLRISRALGRRLARLSRRHAQAFTIIRQTTNTTTQGALHNQALARCTAVIHEVPAMGYCGVRPRDNLTCFSAPDIQTTALSHCIATAFVSMHRILTEKEQLSTQTSSLFGSLPQNFIQDSDSQAFEGSGVEGHTSPRCVASSSLARASFPRRSHSPCAHRSSWSLEAARLMASYLRDDLGRPLFS